MTEFESAIRDDAVTEYWLEFYATGHCTLCGNRGVIDSRGVTTPAGLPVGRLNWCICPNGMAYRRQQDGGPKKLPLSSPH